MNDSNRIFAYVRPVHYHETDQMGMVHHANYVKWFEEARLDFMRQLGLDYAQMEKNGIFLPVLSVHCNYHQRVCFGDTVVIQSELVAYNGIRFEMAYRIFVQGSSICHTSGSSSHCFMNAQGKPLVLKRENKDYDALFRETIGRTMEIREV